MDLLQRRTLRHAAVPALISCLMMVCLGAWKAAASLAQAVTAVAETH
jgi:hypothetical protein